LKRYDDYNADYGYDDDDVIVVKEKVLNGSPDDLLPTS
jgi:hypothetical protein